MRNVRTFYFTNFYWNYHSWIHEPTCHKIQQLWEKIRKQLSWLKEWKDFLDTGMQFSVDNQNFLFLITSRQGKNPVHLRILVGEEDFQNKSEVKSVIFLGLLYESISTTVCYNVSITGRWANGELERIWEEVPTAYPGICMERLRKTTHIFGEERRRVGWDLKNVSPEKKKHYHYADSLRG